MRKVLLWTVGVVVVLAAAGYAAYEFSPWPRALLIRYVFEADAARVLAAQAKHVPPGVAERRDLAYADGGRDTLLDVFYPATIEGTDIALPTIVWVHGGGWVSGSKDEVANYLRILAGRGYTTVGLNYSLAPGAHYPTPPAQVNAALGYLVRDAANLHVDPDRIVLAGDSAGAHVVAQVANILRVPSYAEAVGIEPAIGPERLKGMLLFCGPYDIDTADFEGAFSGFLRTVLWSYSGTRDFLNDPEFDTASVAQYVTADFPPSFISAGNGDPLLPQSIEMAKALEAAGVPVDTLFFPDNREPALPHEYQFNLDNEAGQLALERALAFLQGILPPG
jgi:acetyl esterase/lipase